MSRENVEVVRSIYEAANRRDWDAAFRDQAPDVEYTTLHCRRTRNYNVRLATGRTSSPRVRVAEWFAVTECGVDLSGESREDVEVVRRFYGPVGTEVGVSSRDSGTTLGR